jgi:hypothetical protein
MQPDYAGWRGGLRAQTVYKDNEGAKKKKRLA